MVGYAWSAVVSGLKIEKCGLSQLDIIGCIFIGVYGF